MTTPRVTVPVEDLRAELEDHLIAARRRKSLTVPKDLGRRLLSALSAAPAPEGGAVSIWSDARSVFVRYAELFAMTERYEEASAIADKAAREIEALATRSDDKPEGGAVNDAMVERACSRFVSESDDIWSASVWPEGPDDDGDRGNGGRVRLISEADQHNIRAAMRFALTEALAALQAEQKGGA